ncbi:hypothetical protein [uncultured Psychroserpens sp.]|uniref:hypothetical protein n=1 Tax=uncultured Psychroserpens sp. TaxID=255436 RepID=UPI00261209B6|nr:hypothetical protein [uncultured Psychroserpens sp.]
MINILYIAYQFPPLNIGGSARPAKFAKYLNDFGIHPIVVTLDSNDYSKVYPNPKSDSNLLKGYEDKLDVIEIPTEDLLQRSKNKIRNFLEIYFNIYRGNEKKYWEANYHKVIADYLKHNSVSAILVTAPPFSILPLAVKTSKTYKLPLIVDMRDPWTMWNMSPYSNYVNFLKAKYTERAVFKQARKIIATSKVTLDDFKSLHPSIAKEKFVYIPNGFEHDVQFKSIAYKPKAKITIGYVGSFYYTPESRAQIMMKWYKKKAHRKLQYIPRKEDWLYRSPYMFFKALHQLFLESPELEDRICIRFAGNREPWFDSMVSEYNLENNIEHLGWISREASLEFQASCDFLLMTSAKVIGGRDYSIAGKTFEYFTIQKPILACVADGAQKDVLEHSKMAHFIDVDNAKKAAKQLKDVFLTERTLRPNEAYINSFKVEELTKQLTDVIKSVI